MKNLLILGLLFFLVSGCKNKDAKSNLLSEQNLLKDSANNVRDKIGRFMHDNLNDSAEAQKIKLKIIQTRLIAIQYSIDSLEKEK